MSYYKHSGKERKYNVKHFDIIAKQISNKQAQFSKALNFPIILKLII